MKNMVMILVSIMLGVLTLGMVFAVSGKMNRSVEIKCGLSSAAEQTVSDLVREDGTIAYDNEEMLAAFVEQLVVSTDSMSDLMVEIGNIDAAKGLLSVRVIEQFLYPNGNSGSAESSRTVIWDRMVK